MKYGNYGIFSEVEFETSWNISPLHGLYMPFDVSNEMPLITSVKWLDGQLIYGRLFNAKPLFQQILPYC